MCSYVVDEVVAPAVVAVDRAELATNKVPHGVVVPRNLLVRVVQEGGQHQVGGKHKLGHDVVHQQADQPYRQTEVHEAGDPDDHQTDGHGAGQHVAREERVHGVEVVDAARRVARDEVDVPGGAQAEQGQEEGLAAAVPLTDGIEDLVLVHVASEGVVLAVRQLPAVVGTQQEAVEHVAHHVVQQTIAREGGVAGVVAKDEERPEHGALQ